MALRKKWSVGDRAYIGEESVTVLQTSPRAILVRRASGYKESVQRKRLADRPKRLA